MDNMHYECDEDFGTADTDSIISYGASEDDDVDDLPEDVKVTDSEVNFTFMKEKEIAKLQEDYITDVSTVLSISKSDACLLLPHFNWRDEELKDEWFADEDKVRDQVGLLKKPLIRDQNLKLTCGICFEDCYRSTTLSASCGHPYCRECWDGYISTSICDSGPACLMLRCPEHKCNAAVGPELIENVLKKQYLYDKYKLYLLRSYVEHNRKKIRWCPAPDCEYAVKFDAPDRMSSYDVSCLCSHSYCWNCEEENHRPVFCDTVKKWILKNKDDSPNAQWIVVNTKPCPKCGRSIEKNQGCNHMTCTAPCRCSFCWYCLTEFSKSVCKCHRYRRREDAASGVVEMDRLKAKRELERYGHYYERWENNGKSKKKALEDLDKVKTVHITKLGQIQKNTIEHQYNFIVQAWHQIIECRQVLRWTYAYGYYMSEDDDEKSKRELFEYLQGHAEFSLERLHQCAENELQQFVEESAVYDKDKFVGFKTKLVGLTKVTRTYFDKLVNALEDGLSEILTLKQKRKLSQEMTYKSYEPSSSRVMSTRPWKCHICTYENPGFTRFCQVCFPQLLPLEKGEVVGWACDRCTIVNPVSTHMCGMCGHVVRPVEVTGQL